MELLYSLEGLDCANCASKIEGAINKLPGVTDATLNFTQLSLRVATDASITVDALEERMLHVFNTTEEGASFAREACSSAEQAAERLFIVPGKTPEEGAAALLRAGLDARVQEGSIALCSGETWRDTLARAEAAVPGIKPATAPAEEVAQSDDRKEQREKIERLTLLAGAVVYGLGLVLNATLKNPAVSFVTFAIAYLLSAFPVLEMTAKSIRRLDPFDENFLMSIATLGAFAIGEYPEGVAVMLLYRLGELLQERAVHRSRESIRAMMRLKPDHANLMLGTRTVSVDPVQIFVGDAIQIRPGERVPLDGIVLEGSSSLDVKDMTGESLPRDVAVGDEVISGAINGGGLLVLCVTRPAGDSSVARVLNMVQESSANKARTERFFTRFARIYTPIVVLIAALLMVIPPLAGGGEWRDWIYRGLSFLVVSCPCALVLSIPLSYFGGVGAASRRGVLVKGGESLEALARVDTAVFDKTGTLTEGVMEVRAVECAPGFSPETVLSMAALAESHLDHPIAKAIVKKAGKLPEAAMEGYENLPGEGVRCTIDKRRIAVGNARLMAREGCVPGPAKGTAAHVAIDGAYAGHIFIGDRARAGAKEALYALKRLGVKSIAMLTGDNREAAQEIAVSIGVDQVRAELMPDQKVEALRSIKSKARLFVGDGVNDAPVLAAAEVGVAMGGVGSDAAIAAADMVLMTDDLNRVAEAIDVSRKTRVNVAQNVGLALGIKLLTMVLVALGLGKMWMAVVADAGVALLCVVNALRLSFLKPPRG